jgi:hypothetical protein
MGYRYNPITGELEDDGLGDGSDWSGYANATGSELSNLYANDPTVDWSGYGNLTSAEAKSLADTVAANEAAAGMGTDFFAKLLNSGKSLFTKPGTSDIDYGKLLTIGAGLYGASKSNNQTQPVGYQGKIPKYTATRQAPDAAGRLSGNVTYAPAVAKAEGGSLESGGFVIPADVVSHFGNGSSEAGLKLLKQRLGATPIKGHGDGMSDSIKTTIDGRQPARVANEEAHMTKAQVDAAGGAKKLYAMMERIRQARTGSKEQGKQINPSKFMPGGAVGYADGGAVPSFAGTTGSTIPAGTTGVESSLSNWAGDYVTDMLGKGQALSEMPYEQYKGDLTAGPSALQTKAFTAADTLQTPAAIAQAAKTSGDIASKALGMGYSPTQFGNQFNAPAQGTATNFTNQYQAPAAYQTGTFDTDTFGTGQAQQYMNPYLKAALDPQMAELQRQNQIANLTANSKLTGAGAFGGGRQAIMNSENQRNMMQQMNTTLGQGYNTAYDKAMSQFNADQQRRQAAQSATEQSRQFGASQAATAAQLQAQYGLSAQQAQEAARQFGQNQAMTAAQSAAQYGLAGQQATEASKQFGANYGLQGLQAALQAAQTQGSLGAQQNQTDLANINAQAALGATQRGITAEGLAAQKAAFEEARLNPFKMVQFQQSLLSGLPLAAQTYNQAPTNNLTQFSDAATTIGNLLKKLGQ